MYVHKSFSTMLDKVLRKNIKKKKRDGKIGKPEWNGSTELKNRKCETK